VLVSEGLGQVVELLFKYRPLVWEKGRLALGASRMELVAVAVLALIGAAALVTSVRATLRAGRAPGLVLLTARVLALALLLAILLRPQLVVSTSVTQQNVVGVLVDDSRSMQIPDVAAQPRGEQVRTMLAGGGGLLARLAEQYQVRVFRFSGGAGRINTLDSLHFDGQRTALGSALDDARRALRGLPLAALVLVSDGADNADTTLTASLLGLQSEALPVYAIGAGQDRFPRDIEVGWVRAPPTALKGAAVMVEALVRQRGYGGDSVDVVVEDAGRILGTARVALPQDDQTVTARIRVVLEEEGPRRLAVRVAARPGEMVDRNNERPALVAVTDRRDRVLYFEGEPRFEFAFLRRAVAGDPNLLLVGVQRTADRKYLRLGVEDSLDLLQGFPRTREELFRYRALVLGSVEASFFTADQLRMITDFVGRRGGGFVALGGRRAFGEGGYAGTAMDDLLPFDVSASGDSTRLLELKASPTPAGMGNPVIQLRADEQASAAAWQHLPPLTSVNRVGALKPGAIALLEGADTAGRGRQPLLAYQRYGRGKAAAFTAQDSWLWRMHADVPVDDRTHQQLWRQLLRWLSDGAPDRLTVTVSQPFVQPGEPLTIEAELVDSTWQAINGAAVSAVVTTPGGRVVEQPLAWDVRSDGHYRGRIATAESGRYQVDVRAVNGADTVESLPAFVDAGETNVEFFGAERRRDALQRIATETGGQYYDLDRAADLADDIVYSARGITRTERLDLWDMPAVFVLLLGLLGAEWLARRARGLA
jgi:uncharacterized membrane protein